MNSNPVLVSVAIGYLLGSIPFGYLLVRRFRGSDVRTTGSGNIGATNVARTSPALGIATLILDALKGFVAVLLVLTLYPGSEILAFVAAFSAIFGHVFPVWLRFRGGKGVAVGLGSLVLLTPKAILLAIGIFIAVTAAFRWIALASISAAAALPVFAWLLGETHRTRGLVSGPLPQPLLWIVAGSALIIAKHQSNIRRILNGSEPRFHLKKS